MSKVFNTYGEGDFNEELLSQYLGERETDGGNFKTISSLSPDVLVHHNAVDGIFSHKELRLKTISNNRTAL